MWKLTLSLLLSLAVPALAYAQEAPSPSQDDAAVTAATKDLCHARIAMIGEIATHGDGHTLAFKVALVERLIDRCGFDSILFEANQDEFLHLNRRLQSGQPVTPDDLLSAVGGLWKFYKEFQPLAPFLLARAQTGHISLGGLDDQLGQFGQIYANDEMAAEFTMLLPISEQQACSAALHRRIYFDYPPDKPYSKLDQSQLEACLATGQAAVLANTTVPETAREEQQEMISATQRWVSRDFSPDGENMANRDRSMFQTFEWWQNRLPKNHKVIVRAATVHIAKQGSPAWGDNAGTNLGSLIHGKYGNHARSLGFSAVGGSFRQGKGKFPTLPVAPADSVEVQALQGMTSNAAYVDWKRLTAMGIRPGAFFNHSYQTLRWSEFLDGVVVFRTERPPTDTR